MLRPSRPMMRPFMSSAGSWTTDTVVSAAWPAASRCMTTERMLRTRRSASRLVSSSTWRTMRARVVAGLLLELVEQQLLGLRGRQVRRALELADVALAQRLRLGLALAEPALLLVELLHAGVERLFPADQAFLLAPDLGAARERVVVPARRRRRRRLHGGRRRSGGAGDAGDAGHPFGQQQRRDHEPQGHHDGRDHDLHIRSSPHHPVRRAAGVKSVSTWQAADRAVPGKSGEVEQKAATGPPRQMAARCAVGSEAPGALARPSGRLARVV